LVSKTLHKKRCSPSKTPDSWAGSNVIIQPEGIAVTVSKEKWKKAQGLISKWATRVAETGEVNYKEFESDLGFLIPLCHTDFSMHATILKRILSDSSWLKT
jgi:hypothetical protein